MEKSFLEKSIENIALKKIRQDFRDLSILVKQNPILKKLKFQGNYLGESNNGQGLISWDFTYNDKITEICNIAEVVDNLKNQYIEEETNKIINRIGEFSYLFKD